MNEQDSDIDALMGEAISLHAQGMIGRAEEVYKAVLKRQRNHPEALHMMGVLNFQRGDAAIGNRYIHRALAARPDFPDALNSLAKMHLQNGENEQALQLAERALVPHGDFLAGLYTLSRAQLRLKDFSGVVSSCERMAVLSPDEHHVLADWAAALLNLGRFAEAETKYGELIARDPTNLDNRCFHAQALKGQGRFAESLEKLDEILAENPEYVPALVHAGDVLQAMNDPDAAIERFRKAIALQPDHAEAHFNLGVSLLTIGAYHEGWLEYGWRFKMEAYSGFKPPAQAPLWEGEPLAGKSILIFGEQGLGDTLQFARYATDLAKSGAKVSCQCSPLVADIVATIEGIDEMYTFEQTPPEVDYQISMMELPRIFDTNADTIPAPGGYLRAPKDQFQLSGRPAVGIVWQGNFAHKNDAYRSLPLACFDNILDMPGVNFYSLQVGEGARQIEALGWQNRIEDLSPRLISFGDTADVMSKLDLVITVDTSVAHLAGGLGVPVWVLLPTIADWRWGRTATTTGWYGSMHLFRQQRLGHWDTVFDELGKALAGLFANRS